MSHPGQGYGRPPYGFGGGPPPPNGPGGGFGAEQPNQGVTVSAVISAVVNFLSLCGALINPLTVLTALAGAILAVIGAATNNNNPRSGKVLMLLSWAMFLLTVVIWIGVLVVGVLFFDALVDYEYGDY